jgi:acyl-coenzyme A thioesterase PaaI-like protein
MSDSPITPKTHLKINSTLCGTIKELTTQGCRISLTTTQEMVVDEYGLIHGGFIFGLADYAAMMAINHPNVVLAGSNVHFAKPIKVNTKLLAEATINKTDNHKFEVFVQVWADNEEIFYGDFMCIVTQEHVLINKKN